MTAKSDPGDFDVAWDMTGVDADAIDDVFLDFADERASQMERFDGEFFPAQLLGRGRRDWLVLELIDAEWHFRGERLSFVEVDVSRALLRNDFLGVVVFLTPTTVSDRRRGRSCSIG